MMCPSCRQDEAEVVETTCPDPDEPGDVLRFSVCKNCDYGINEHTEGECACPSMASLVPIDIAGMLTDRNPQDLYW